MNRQQWQGRHFTTIELLVIVAVLSILTSILLPALAKAREKVKATVCVSMLKQHAAAVFMYSIDESDNFPSPALETAQTPYWFATYWRTVEDYYPKMGPFYGTQGIKDDYVKGNDIMRPYLCPSAADSYDFNHLSLDPTLDYWARLDRQGSYVTASMWYTAHPAAADQMAGGRLMSNLPQPSRYFFMNDVGFNDQSDDRSYPQWKTKLGLIDGTFEWAHPSGFGVGFLDGHGRFYQRKTRIITWESAYTRLLPDDMN